MCNANEKSQLSRREPIWEEPQRDDEIGEVQCGPAFSEESEQKTECAEGP